MRLILIMLLLLACNLSQPAILPTSTPTLPPPTHTPTVPPAPESGWTQLQPGLEHRVYVPQFLGNLDVLRIDPALYSFRAHYQPGQAMTLDAWREQLPDAAALINANFFTPEGTILGLLVSDGVVHGASFTDRGGMLQVQNETPRVRSIIYEPYFGEALEQAVSGFPLLVYNGEAAYTRPDRQTRRTVIAQDSQGRILLMATPLLGLTLVDLSTFLAESDMDIVIAVNLDGGGSTLMAYEGYQLPSIDPVPAVLAVYTR